MSLFFKLQEEDRIEEMNRANANYMIIGGAAMQFYGSQRKRKDLDILIQQTPENIQKLIDAGGFGFQTGRTVDEWLQPNAHIAEEGIDIIASWAGVDTTRFFSDVVITKIEDIQVHLPSMQNLIEMKSLVCTEKDVEDLKFLMSIS